MEVYADYNHNRNKTPLAKQPRKNMTNVFVHCISASPCLPCKVKNKNEKNKKTKNKEIGNELLYRRFT